MLNIKNNMLVGVVVLLNLIIIICRFFDTNYLLILLGTLVICFSMLNFKAALVILILNLGYDYKINTAITITNFDLAFIIFSISFLVHLVISGKSVKKKIKLNKLVGFFVLLVVISSLYSPELEGALAYVKGTIEAFILYLIIMYWADNHSKIKFICKTIIAVAIFYSCIGILQHLTGSFGWSGFEFPRGYIANFFGIGVATVKQANGGFFHFNSLGQYLCLTIPLLFTTKKILQIKKYYYWLLVVFGIAALIFTYSRGALISLILSVLFIMVMRKKSKALIISILIPILLMIMFNIYKIVISNEGYLDTLSLGLRFNIWKCSIIELTKSLPRILFGYGINSFKEVTAKYAQLYNEGIVYTVWQAHNTYLLIWFEMGLVGLMTFISIVKRYLGIVVKKEISFDEFEKAVSLGIVAGLLGFLIQCFVDHAFWQAQFRIIFFMYLALIDVVIVNQRLKKIASEI